jgi:hypothetical protein
MDTVRFTCQSGCTNCCDQKGNVYLTEDDLQRAAAFTGMSAAAFEAKGPLIQIGTAMETAEEQRRAYPDMYK